MAEAERPPTISEIALTVDGYPVDDDYIIAGQRVNGMLGASIHGSVTATNCATVAIVVRGPSTQHHFEFQAEHDTEGLVVPSQTYDFDFTATESCVVEATGINPFGASVEHPTLSRPLRILTPPSPAPFTFADITITTLSREDIDSLSRTWTRYQEYGIELDTSEFISEQLTIDTATHDAISGQSDFHAEYAQRLSDALSAFPPISSQVAHAMTGMPTLGRDFQPPLSADRLRVPTVPRVVPEPTPTRIRE